ncbi:MAG TPA: hypothetical protein PLE54_05575 [Burkholderiaceae bacterium]|nr:hypothetical protein [Burkholderiaceae bacterium]HQR70053.1 hypothetical protein [Burkholderiaceae bacterium]
MKRRESIAISAIGLWSAATLQPALAQGWRDWRGSGGWSSRGPYQRLYNPESAYSAHGTIESIQSFVPLPGMAPGVHMMVKTASESVNLQLGPIWFIERLEPTLSPGDEIEFRGSRVTIDGKTVVIASEIKKGDNTLVLRNAAGVPAWAGWRR